MANNPSSIRGWRRIALPASLIVNLFLAAVIGGHLLRRSPDIARGPMPLAQSLATAEAILSPQDAAPFGAVLRRDAPRYVGAAQQLAEARVALGHAITAETYDPVAVRRALLDWQQKSDNFVDHFSDTLTDSLAQVSPEGTAAACGRAAADAVYVASALICFGCFIGINHDLAVANSNFARITIMRDGPHDRRANYRGSKVNTRVCPDGRRYSRYNITCFGPGVRHMERSARQRFSLVERWAS